jgi:ferredoxin
MGLGVPWRTTMRACTAAAPYLRTWLARGWQAKAPCPTECLFYGIIHWMPATADVVKMEPKSEGIATVRKKRPKELAVITECCTGCAGSPACVPYCPVADCMYWVPDEEHPPFGRIDVDPVLCIGCKKCTSKGPDGAFLDGCPWDAIEMIPIEEVEQQIGFKMPV